MRVVRAIPKRMAAPSAPPMRPLHAVSACITSPRCFLSYCAAPASMSSRELLALRPVRVFSARTASVIRSAFDLRSSARRTSGMAVNIARIRAVIRVTNSQPVRSWLHQDLVVLHRIYALVYEPAATSGGSSGPLFNRNGKVIGINFAVRRDFGGLNLAVPANTQLKSLTSYEACPADLKLPAAWCARRTIRRDATCHVISLMVWPPVTRLTGSACDSGAKSTIIGIADFASKHGLTSRP